jgi:ribosomal protein L40E
MVNCPKCGTENGETAVYCVNCGAKLERPKDERWDKSMEKWGEDFGKRAEKWGEEFGKRAEEWGDNFGRRTDRGCFGLPHGGLVFGLLIGAIVILVGVFALLSGLESLRYFWPLLLVVFGLMIAAGALYSLTRRR